MRSVLVGLMVLFGGIAGPITSAQADPEGPADTNVKLGGHSDSNVKLDARSTARLPTPTQWCRAACW